MTWAALVYFVLIVLSLGLVSTLPAADVRSTLSGCLRTAYGYLGIMDNWHYANRPQTTTGQTSPKMMQLLSLGRIGRYIHPIRVNTRCVDGSG